MFLQNVMAAQSAKHIISPGVDPSPPPRAHAITPSCVGHSRTRASREFEQQHGDPTCLATQGGGRA